MACEPDYRIDYFAFGAQAPQVSLPTTISWNRKLNDISTAKLIHPTTGDACCDVLRDLEPFITEVAISRNGQPVWYGWVQRVEYARNFVTVDARDALWWLMLRIVRDAVTYETQDVAAIFEALWVAAMAPDPINATLHVQPTGVVETRKVTVSSIHKVWNIVKEMLDTGLDVTAIVQDVYAGTMQWEALKLRASDITGDPSITKEGDLFGDRIMFFANADVRSAWPPGPPTRSPAGYPLVERTLADLGINDQASADNATKARWESSTIVPRVVNTNDSIVLSPSSTYDIPDLLPGALVNFDAEGLCLTEEASYRLSGVAVEVTQGKETVNLELGAVGTLNPFEEADAAVGEDVDTTTPTETVPTETVPPAAGDA